MNSLYKSTFYQKYRGFMISCIDVCIVLFSYLVAYMIQNNFFLNEKTIALTKLLGLGLFFMLLLHFIVLRLFKTQMSLWTYTGPNEIIRTFLSCLVCFLIMSYFVLKVHLFNIELIALSELLCFVFLLGARMLYRMARRYIMDLERVENCLIVGAGSGGYLLMNEIYHNMAYPYNVIGFVDDFKKKGTMLSGKPVLGTIEEIKQVCEENNVCCIFITISSVNDKRKQEILDLCASTSIPTKMMRILVGCDANNHISFEDIDIKDLLNRPSIDLKVDQIGSYLTNKVVCVTGAGGSIGSELCRQIVHFNPSKLIMVDINENALYMLKQEFLVMKRKHEMKDSIELESLIISIREREEIYKLMKNYKPDVVYHAAAHKHVPLMEDRPTEAIRNNIFGTKNVIDACCDCGISRFIMISTDKAVNPTNVMGATKRMTEMYMQSRTTHCGIHMAAVRFGNVLGSNGSVIPIFKEQIKNGGPVTVTHRDIKRYFMTIPEAAQLVLQAGFYAFEREIFVLDMGQPVKIWDLADKMIRLAGLVPGRDIEIQEIGLRPGEKMFEELALEMEECHKTDNNLIFVHEKMDIDSKVVDSDLVQLQELMETTDDKQQIKDVLMNMIQD